MVLQIPPITAKPTITWEPLPANFILPDDPVECTASDIILGICWRISWLYPQLGLQ